MTHSTESKKTHTTPHNKLKVRETKSKVKEKGDLRPRKRRQSSKSRTNYLTTSMTKMKMTTVMIDKKLDKRTLS
jgi:hypothetical protein